MNWAREAIIENVIEVGIEHYRSNKHIIEKIDSIVGKGNYDLQEVTQMIREEREFREEVNNARTQDV